MSKIIIPIKIIKNIFKENFRWILALEVVYISYKTGTRALPDIYAQFPQAQRPRELCIYIRQSTLACVITYICIPVCRRIKVPCWGITTSAASHVTRCMVAGIGN